MSVFVYHTDNFKYDGVPHPNDDDTFDFQMNSFLVFNSQEERVPWPRSITDENVIMSGHNVLLNRICVSLDDLNFVEDFVELRKKLRTFFNKLTFRRVYKVKKVVSFSEPRIFGWKNGEMVSRKCTHKDIENIPQSSNPNHQKNKELIYRKRYIMEKGNYYGFTNKRSLRDNDRWNSQSIYFNGTGYNEIDFVDNADLSWVKPDNDTIYSIPYSGDLVCGIVKENQQGPYFSKWFMCSEQFFKMVTSVLDTSHETVEKNRTALNRRLRTNNFERWLDEKDVVFDDEAQQKFHLPRYEEAWNYKYVYSWLGMILGAQTCDVPCYEDGVDYLRVLSSIHV